MKLHKKLTRKSLRRKMVVWAFLFIIPILVLFYGVTLWATVSFRNETQTNLQQILKPYAREIDVTMDSAMRYIANWSIDLDFLDEADELAALEKEIVFGDELSNALSQYMDIDAIFVFSENRIRFVQNYGRDYALSRAMADHLTAYLLLDRGDAPLFREGYQYMSVEDQGYLFIALELEDNVVGCWFSFDTLLGEIRSAGIEGLELASFSDGDGAILEGDATLDSQRNRLTVSEPLSQSAFTLTAILDSNIVLASGKQLQWAVVAALILALGLFIAYIWIMRRSLIDPLSRLANTIGQVKGGNLQPVEVDEREDDEIRDIYHALNGTIREVETLKIQVYEEQIARQDIQMQLFQLQIRPHFFLNALNSILSFARSNDYDRVQKMTLYLANHCRYILYNVWFVSLEEELEYTQNYIGMQDLLRDTKYTYEEQVDDALLDQEIPILIIQIFVENALKHTKGLFKEMTVKVAAEPVYPDGGEAFIRITVDDTGGGFSVEILRALDGGGKAPEGDRGIGIENVRQRLALIYGGRASLTFSNNAQGGAHVEIHLPFDHENEVIT